MNMVVRIHRTKTGGAGFLRVVLEGTDAVARTGKVWRESLCSTGGAVHT